MEQMMNQMVVPIQKDTVFFLDTSCMKWKVLDVDQEKGRMLVTSDEPLSKVKESLLHYYYKSSDYFEYSQDIENLSWETSIIRKYLNNEFLNDNFSSQEQDMIIGNDTVFGDKIFILSREEVKIYNEKLLKNDRDFWIRRVKDNFVLFKSVGHKFSVPKYNFDAAAVYPCFYIDLKSDCFKSKCNDQMSEFLTEKYKVYKTCVLDVLQDLGENAQLEIYEGVTTISKNVFKNMKLKKLVLPSTLDRICEWAFCQVDIKDLVFTCTLKKLDIEEYAFISTKVSVDLNAFDFSNKVCTQFAVLFGNKNFIEKCNEKTMASIIVYRSEKRWKDYSFQKSAEFSKKKIKSVIQEIIEILSREPKLKPSSYKSVVEFVFLQNGEYLEQDAIQKLNEVLIEKKQKNASKLLLENPKIQKVLNIVDDSIHPVERFVNENWKQEEIVPALVEKIKEGIHYKDSDEICKPNVLIYAISQYENQLLEKRKLPISEYKHKWIPIQTSENADFVIHSLDENELVEFLNSLESIVATGRYGNDEQIKKLISSMRSWEFWYSYGVTGRQNIIVARSSLLLSETKEAMVYLDKNCLLDVYAQKRGKTADDIRDTILSDIGFDRNGKKIYDLGNKTVEASLNGNLTVSLYDTTANKIVKSIPKKGADEQKYNLAKSDLSQLKKNIKKIFANRKESLLEAFLDQKKLNPTSFKQVYFENPILNMVGKMLVWKQNQQLFAITNDKAIDVNGNDVSINETDPIYVAHPMYMNKEEIVAWQQYFISNSIKQPFEQIWEPVIESKTINKNRYNGIMIPYYRFHNQEKMDIFVEDNDFHNEIDIWSNLCDLKVNRIDVRRHEIDMKDNFEIESIQFDEYSPRLNHLIVYFDKITAYGRIVNDDVTIQNTLNLFTLAQIEEFIKVANENKAMNVLALLMEYKNNHFSDYDPMDEFTLD